MTSEPAERRPDHSMALIRRVFDETLDPAYASVSRERERKGLAPSTGTRTPTLIITAIIVGLLLGMAASSLRGRSSSISAAREDLISQIQEHQDIADQRTAQIKALQEEIASAESSALGAGSTDRSQEMDRLRLVTGGQAVQGPGVLVTLDNGAPVDSGTDDTTSVPENEVTALDLQHISNDLWSAGAEAVAINGHRLTAQSTIRAAGAAITVNFTPLTRPYTIAAIGDPSTMPEAFVSGPGGAYLSVLRDRYGIVVDTKTAGQITLPSAVTRTLLNARPMSDNGGTASPSPGTSSSSTPTTPAGSETTP